MTAPRWKEIEVKADLAEIERIRGFLAEMLREMHCAEEESIKLELAFHEILVNIVSHAYPNGSGPIKVRFWSEEEVFYMEARDRGVPFNPAEVPPLELEQKINSGTAGGFGIYLFKALTDGYSYKRDGDENVLTIFKRIGKG
ncbi:MAG: ATP-binding protein [Acidobacteria bacterium]|nr:ATP-binding protein [Acidobacteriota bacterium]